jgi:hypothetical protein
MSKKRWCRAGFNIAEADENEVKLFIHPEVLWNILDHPDEEDPREEDLDEEIQ